MTPKSAASLAPPLAEAPLPEAPAAAAREIVLASDNPGKLREFAQLFAGYEVKVSPQSAFGVPAAAETGADFVDNALIKARHAAALVGERLVVADDSGLEVDALDGAPGLRSARYAGVGATAADNLRLLLKNLASAPRSPARFRCAIACLRRADDPAPVWRPAFGRARSWPRPGASTASATIRCFTCQSRAAPRRSCPRTSRTPSATGGRPCGPCWRR